jgi:hypothetical protein
MQPEQWTRLISASVVPVVIISACGLLCLAFYNRLASIVGRLRGFQRERLEEQHAYARALFAGSLDKFMMLCHQQRLAELEQQTIRVTVRGHLIRRTLMCLLGTIVCLTFCSLATGLSVIWQPAMYLAVVFFFLATPLLLLGISCALLEMRNALEPVELESQFMSRLTRDFERMAASELQNLNSAD